MYKTVSPETIKALAAIDGPSICNAIEGFNVRPKNQGFMLPEIKSVFQDLPPVVGYAVTGVISANQPEGRNVSREDWWDLIASVPEPRFIVLHDIDNPPLGAYWGEVQGNIHKALGAVGVATDGDSARLGRSPRPWLPVLRQRGIGIPCIRALGGDRHPRYRRGAYCQYGRPAARRQARALLQFPWRSPTRFRQWSTP